MSSVPPAQVKVMESTRDKTENDRDMDSLQEANDQLISCFQILQDDYLTKKEHLSDAAKIAMLQIDQRMYIDWCPQTGYTEENLLEIRLVATYLSEIASTRTRVGGVALHAGFDTGYFTTCLAILLGEKGQVVAVDPDEEVVKKVIHHVEESNPELLLNRRVKFCVGDGSQGLPDEGPYDVMAMCVQLPAMLPTILNQLKPRGILIATVGSPNNWTLQKITKDAEGLLTTTILKKKAPKIGS